MKVAETCPRQPRSVNRSVIPLALAFVFVCGCSKVSEQTTLGSTRHSWTQPGVLRVAISQDAKTLNPLLASNTVDGFVTRLLFEPLISADSKGDAVPMLATAVPSTANGGISHRGLTITYHLRSNARWTDGQPVTSEDVRWSWQALMNPSNDVVSRHGYDDIAGIDTPNPHTVVVHLKQPFAPFVNTFFAESDQPYLVVPAHVLARYPNVNQLAFNTKPLVSDGPFRFVEWIHGDHILVTANDDFFMGRPKLHEVRLAVIPDENTSIELLRTHEIDYMYQASVNTYPQIREIPGVAVVWNSMNGYQAISLNLSHPLLQDVRVRLAIASAIDKRALVQQLTSGQEKEATEDLPDWMWAFDPAALPPAYDPQRARELLRSAGYVPGPDGIVRRAGVPLRLLFVSDVADATHRKLSVIVQSMLRAVGIDADIKLYPADLLYAPAAMGGIMHRGQFDMMISPWYSGIDPDNSSQFMCQNVPPNGYNDSRYCVRAMDEAQRQALSTYEQPARRQAYSTIERLLARDNPEIYIWWQRQQEPISVDFRGFAPNPVEESWNAWQWSI